MNNLIKALFLGLSVLLLQGCGPKTFEVKNSDLYATPFSIQDASSSKNSLAFNSQESAGSKSFSHGRLAVNLNLDGNPVEPKEYLQHNVLQELKAKGIDVSEDATSESVLNIEQFYIRNHRTNGYTPFITFSTFKGSLNFNNQSHDIAVFVKRGKVPVWSFNEVLEPTYNEPLALTSKEVAAKINRVMFGQRISDEQVNELVNKIDANPKDKKSYLLVYELGFGNNNAAINHLVEFSKYEEEYIRLAAISALGTLQADSQVDHLWSIYNDSTSWQDRAMALKALGDIGTAASMDKLDVAKSNISNEKKKAKTWFNEILDLYL